MHIHIRIHHWILWASLDLNWATTFRRASSDRRRAEVSS